VSGTLSALRLAVVPGDGIGPEVVAEGVRALEAGCGDAVKVATTEYDLGARRWHETGETLPESVLDELRGHDAILLGAVGDPTVPSGVLERGLLLRLRFELDHHVNLRPARLYPGVLSPLAGRGPEDIDFVVVREGTEGPYVGNGGTVRRGTPHEIATEVSVNTAYGVERVVRDAFGRAQRRPRRHLTLVHKTNVLTNAGDLWARTVAAVAADFPDVSTDYLHVDAASIFLVTDPGRFDVVVTDNLFGDIVTDLAAAVTGGIGLAARQPRREPHQPLDVRAGARQRARHRGAGRGRPDRDDPVRRAASRPCRAGRPGRPARDGSGGRPGLPGRGPAGHPDRGRGDLQPAHVTTPS